jgi:hypothetical protein
MKKQSILNKTLNRALSLARPHLSQTTSYFTYWLLENLPAALRTDAWFDECNNLHIDNRKGSASRSLFVAHVDTVHHKEGVNKIRKTKTTWYADGSQLGADDGVGCAMLMHMIHADVPGYYIFTQGEEKGGIGAKFLAAQYPQLLSEFDRAVAFDRRGIDSVITHQGWGRCCSDVFADELAAQLNSTPDAMMYLPDNTGVYTDTAEFVDIIPECTNLSCGYLHEHSDREQLDMVHFAQLAKAVLAIQWDALPTDRDPAVKEPEPSYDFGSWATSYKSGYDAFDTGYGTGNSGLLSEDEYLYECILDAQQGFMKGLLDLMAESVYPEEPKMAIKFIDRKRLTDETLHMAAGMVGVNDSATVLATLFDMAYAE